MPISLPLSITAGSVLLLVLRVIWICPAIRPQRPPTWRKNDTCSIGVFLGSGGHTGEMKILVSSLDFARYKPRTYVVCHGDELSLTVISGLESSHSDKNLLARGQFEILSLPRARRVGQPPLSTLISTIKTLIIAFWTTFLLPFVKRPGQPWVDLLLVNGPGTCVVLVVISYVRRILGLPFTRVIYIESFARVNSLSLSGKLLRPWVDAFVVQWPDAAGKDAKVSQTSRIKHRGWLV